MERQVKLYFTKIRSKFITLDILAYAYDDLNDCIEIFAFINKLNRELLINNYSVIIDKYFTDLFCFYCYLNEISKIFFEKVSFDFKKEKYQFTKRY